MNTENPRPYNTKNKVYEFVKNADGDVRPNDFQSLGISPKTVSRHLRDLNNEGLIKRELKNGLIWWSKMINCREEFEKWMSKELCEDMPKGAFDRTSLGYYKHRFVHEAWVAWKAAWDCSRCKSDKS